MLIRHSIRIGIALFALAISHQSRSAELELPVQDRDSAWFAPTLVTNNQALCAAALEAERVAFFAPDEPRPEIPGLTLLTTDNAPIADPDVTVLDNPVEMALTLSDGRKAFLRFFGYPGCGGGCETAAVGIDAERVIDDESSNTVPRTYRYGPDRWMLFKSSVGDFYLRGTVDAHTQWYRVAAPDRWELACDIALKPDELGAKEAMYPREVLEAIDSLRMAANTIAGGAGNCGTLQTAGRWSQYRDESLESALYQPWAIVSRRDPRGSANSFGDSERTADQLALWSLGGVTEYRDFVTYRDRLARAIAVVTEFYRAKFGWSQSRAAQMADAALKGAISRGFGFYIYQEPYTRPGERELREAILSKASIETIGAIAVDPKQIDHEGEDSILNVAIEYPEALSYLLQKGFNPNIGNAFGKTPLMYAAQYNQISAAEMLLKAGADPNATTRLPDDICGYAITTSNLTPLHYATRYSSARLTELLLKHGAVTFIQSASDSGLEYPLDRLRQYTAIVAMEERNPHIAEAEVAALSQLLAVPSEAQKHAIAAELVSRARSEYARGDGQYAYQHLRMALMARPDLPDAIADLPLIALRAGYIGPAISAANRAIKVLTNPNELAAAWFNKGLICEHPQALDVHTVDDASCGFDELEPFLTSWKLQPLPARGDKLRALLLDSAASCAANDPGRHYRVAHHDLYRTFRIYVLHRPGETIDTSQIRWPGYLAIHDRKVEPEIAGAKVVQSVDLGEDVVTVLEVPVGTYGSSKNIKLWVEGRECTPELGRRTSSRF